MKDEASERDAVGNTLRAEEMKERLAGHDTKVNDEPLKEDAVEYAVSSEVLQQEMLQGHDTDKANGEPLEKDADGHSPRAVDLQQDAQGAENWEERLPDEFAEAPAESNHKFDLVSHPSFNNSSLEEEVLASISTLSSAQLKAELRSRGVSEEEVEGCFEKNELVALLEAARSKLLTEQERNIQTEKIEKLRNISIQKRRNILKIRAVSYDAMQSELWSTAPHPACLMHRMQCASGASLVMPCLVEITNKTSTQGRNGIFYAHKDLINARKKSSTAAESSEWQTDKSVNSKDFFKKRK